MMIESKSQLVDDFRTKADAFLAAPSVGSGIAFDDAAVTLKRYVLTEMHDQALASLLARLPKLIRALDVAAVIDLRARIEEGLRD